MHFSDIVRKCTTCVICCLIVNSIQYNNIKNKCKNIKNITFKRRLDIDISLSGGYAMCIDERTIGRLSLKETL